MPGTTECTTTMMRAMVRERYGPPRAVTAGEVARPELRDDGVLVRVRASSVNRADWYAVTGRPYAGRPLMGMRPKSRLIGSDFAGEVEAIGSQVSELRPGDEVFGAARGAFAEFVAAGSGVTRKPANLTWEEAAAIPLAAITALQGLRDYGGVREGSRVLVNGASGGVGTFAVQIAKALGADVTAVCSTRNVEQARALGADRVVDYTREDFTRTARRYDTVFDNAGSRSCRAIRRILEPEATVVLVGGPAGRFVGPLAHIAAMRLASRRRQTTAFFVADVNRPDLETVAALAEAGRVRAVVERRYDLAELPAALRYMGEGHVRGKLVVTV